MISALIRLTGSSDQQLERSDFSKAVVGLERCENPARISLHVSCTEPGDPKLEPTCKLEKLLVLLPITVDKISHDIALKGFSLVLAGVV